MTTRSRYGFTIILAAGVIGLGYLMASGPRNVVPLSPASGPSPDLLRQILADANAPVVGNTAGAVTVVEFFDYRCPYCRALRPVLENLMAQDRRVRLVFKEWPIFGGASVTAARFALAARWQGKYVAVHKAIFGLPSAMDAASIRQAAMEAGADMARLDRDLAAHRGEIDMELARVADEARALGFQGTPGLIVGTMAVPGALGASELARLIDQLAQNGRRRNPGSAGTAF